MDPSHTPSRRAAKRPPTPCSARPPAPLHHARPVPAGRADRRRVAARRHVSAALRGRGRGGGPLLRQTLAGLKQRVRTRPARVPLPCWPSQTEALSRALATLLGEAAEAHQLSPEARWRIARALVADLLCLWLPPGICQEWQWTR